MARTKSEHINKILKDVATDMFMSGKDVFTLNSFDHRGVSNKTIDFRIKKTYGLLPDWVPFNRCQQKQVFKLSELIDVMKKRGDWQ